MIYESMSPMSIGLDPRGDGIFPDAIFSILLITDMNHPAARVIKKRWSDFHYLTGERLTIATYFRPDDISDKFKNYWKDKLGDSFENIWDEWLKCEPGESLKDIDKIDSKLQPSDLPCFAFYAKENETRAIIHKIPSWEDENEMYEYLTGVVKIALDCQKNPVSSRLECLEKNLNSIGARFRTYFGHSLKKSKDYIKSNPSFVTVTICSFLGALNGFGALAAPGVFAYLFLNDLSKRT
ncbi:hypothetical protein [Desulfocurvibacter africanus]|uniref:Uncharacterized protein n=1 Tax=Desulfocurvibacter africanus subsp. africanus str. Walvis Bay TaxID=690850 RepID=F3YZ86_DESAF|nr:hypothetical protein [Desulfocurvibacter africanus]EGJ50842.1 hypothetical protein Desaf_2520 [Desulfocurvibacter africanus subsp. africanus str. Walvis Bay]